MREEMGKRGYLAYGIAILLSLYLAAFFSWLYVPKRQLFPDTDNLKDQKAMAFVYDEAPVELLPAGDEAYAGIIRSGESELQVSVRLRDSVPERCTVTGEEKAFIPVSRCITSEGCLGTCCVKPGAQTTKHLQASVLLFVGLSALFTFALRESRRAGRDKALFTYSDAKVRAIGRKPILLSFVVTAISLVIFYGCDLKPLSKNIILWQKGVDLFQLFTCVNPYKSMEFYSWQYGDVMLAGYGLPPYLLYPILGGFQPGACHRLQSFLYKMLNMLLMNDTVLSLISFLLERGFLKGERA